MQTSPALVDATLPIPDVPHYLNPILATVPLQLFAYYIAVRRGCDVDQPRNLAKSVYRRNSGSMNPGYRLDAAQIGENPASTSVYIIADCH